MSIASEISRLQTAKSDLKTSIENKGVTVPSATTLDGYAALVDQISGGGGGGGGSATDPVRFIDYDGTILYSYSAQDFAALSAMPANPTHTGLTSQGWNWTLADAKAQVTAMGNCDIGQMYVTDDGKTRVYISLVDSARLSPYLGICPNGTVVVDWGDNTATSTLTGTSLSTVVRAQHTYATAGDYVITLTVSSGSFAIYGNSSYGTYLLTRTNDNITSQKCYQNAIKKVELGANVLLADFALSYCYSLTSITIPSSVTAISSYAFAYCSNLTSIIIPNSVTDTGNYTFYYCYSLARVIISSSVTRIGANAFNRCHSLASIIIPNNVTDISLNAFDYCYSLASITIPSNVTSIWSATFRNCYSLTSVMIPNSVTTIGAYAFSNCYCVAEYHLLSTTPPTLANTNAFTGILADCKIYVPSASLNTYKRATNWSTYASKMVGE